MNKFFRMYNRCYRINKNSIVLHKHSGFTVIELIMYFAVIVSLALGCTIRSYDYIVASKKCAAKSDLSTISMALDKYRIDTGKMPASLSALSVSVNSSGPWLKANTLIDPWKNYYHYIAGPDGTYFLWSDGPNGQTDGEYTSSMRENGFSGDDIGLYMGR